MADSALLAAGGGDAPLSYIVPGATAIRLKQAHVSYVDNGAGGAWLPAIRIVSDSNHTMGVAADQAVKVTAGSDADVSFFPGVKRATPAAGAALDTLYAITASPYNIAATGGAPTDPTVWASVVQSGSAYTWPVGGDSSQIGLNAAGLYAAWYSPDPVGTWPIPANGFITFLSTGIGSLAGYPFLNSTTSAFYAGVSDRPFVQTLLGNIAAPTTFQLFAGNSTVGVFAITTTTLVIVRLGDFLS